MTDRPQIYDTYRAFRERHPETPDNEACERVAQIIFDASNRVPKWLWECSRLVGGDLVVPKKFKTVPPNWTTSELAETSAFG